MVASNQSVVGSEKPYEPLTFAIIVVPLLKDVPPVPFGLWWPADSRSAASLQTTGMRYDFDGAIASATAATAAAAASAAARAAAAAAAQPLGS